MADVFGKITGKIDKSIKTVSSKGKELMETARLKGEIQDIQSSINVKFQALGNRVFEMINREALSEEELKADCKNIATLFKRVTELEDALKQIEIQALKVRYGADTIKCSKCGSYISSEVRFCTSCGSSMEEIKAKVEDKTCSTCNSPVKEDAKFCMRCGAKVE